MTGEKAKEILTRYQKDYTIRMRSDFDEAVALGLEALKRLQDMSISPCTTADEILSGETRH